MSARRDLLRGHLRVPQWTLLRRRRVELQRHVCLDLLRQQQLRRVRQRLHRRFDLLRGRLRLPEWPLPTGEAPQHGSGWNRHWEWSQSVGSRGDGRRRGGFGSAVAGQRSLRTQSRSRRSIERHRTPKACLHPSIVQNRSPVSSRGTRDLVTQPLQADRVTGYQGDRKQLPRHHITTTPASNHPDSRFDATVGEPARPQ